MQITRFGHAAVLVEAAGTRLLLDPGAFSPDDVFGLDGLDVIVVTHQHDDHVDLDKIGGLQEQNPGAQLYAEPEVAEQLRERGGDWHDLSPDQQVDIGGLSVTGVGGRHADIHPDLPSIGNVGVLVTAEGEPVLFHPGDSYAEAPDGVDVLAVPLGAPWAKLSETVDFVRAVSPRVLFPIHDRTIADLAYGMYWGQVADMGGVADARQLGQDESTFVEGTVAAG